MNGAIPSLHVIFCVRPANDSVACDSFGDDSVLVETAVEAECSSELEIVVLNQ